MNPILLLVFILFANIAIWIRTRIIFEENKKVVIISLILFNISIVLYYIFLANK